MDAGTQRICHAINSLPGLRTTESCEGHGIRRFYICIKATSLQAVYPLCRALRNVWLKDENLTSQWAIELKSTDIPSEEDDVKRPMQVFFRSNDIGNDEICRQSTLIAKYLEDYHEAF